MSQYSLTKMTSLLEKHYEKQYKLIKNNKEIVNYNNHKIRHTYAVLFVAQKIMTYEKDIFNNENVIKKAEVANLLHDIWRFYQNNWKRILSWEEFEHGDIGYEILKQEWITDLSILFAVKYHNKININWLYDEKEFQKSNNKKEIINIVNLVRDADKLQNLEYMMFNSNDKLYLEQEISDKISNDVFSEFIEWKSCIKYDNVKTYVDKILYYASWCFDLNYKITKTFLLNDNFISFVENQLENVWVSNYITNWIIWKLKNSLEN